MANPFRAAYAQSFPWLFSAAYAIVFTLFFGVMVLLTRNTFGDVIESIGALDRSGIDRDAPGSITATLSGIFKPLVPFLVLSIVGSWALWAMFEAASQRRYIRDEGFTLRFGGDELRMMVVALLWSLMYLVFISPILFVMLGGIASLLSASVSNSPEDVIARQAFSMIGSLFGLMLLVFPVYVFFATRLAPCFAMTIKDRRIVFFDAWNVSRGRFWPILGAYLILAVSGGIIVSVIDQVLQMALMTTSMPSLETVESADDLTAVLTSTAFVIPLSIYALLRLFLSGLLQHFTGGPAAFAARHDPRGGVDDAAQMAVFD
ncbi:hypothetical protein HJO_17299 [Hyphomonas johnsonii MHS-2]|uniref:Glycerophosphoryl diester phosphodiesterase membrane domain-containing protein n=1 Tax=Hyphomonas johnsonii MHS-2 TaxID=1280950 RepID=A0A059F969_9PROT|nr:hypothetical protein HJO_17299 [Hyphomonas johnsonii MHS-2]